MERILFDCYRKLVKDTIPTSQRIKQLPIILYIFAVLTFGSAIISILAIIPFNNQLLSLVGMIAEGLFALMAVYCVERYEIKNIAHRFEKYKEFCTALKNELKKYNVETDEQINDLHTRLLNSIEVKKKDRKESNEHIDKWIQVLIVPFLLAIITAIISSADDYVEMISKALSVLLAFVLPYGAFAAIRSLYLIPDKRKLEQMQEFADNLQAIIDFSIMESIKMSDSKKEGKNAETPISN